MISHSQTVDQDIVVRYENDRKRMTSFIRPWMKKTFIWSDAFYRLQENSHEWNTHPSNKSSEPFHRLLSFSKFWIPVIKVKFTLFLLADFNYKKKRFKLVPCDANDYLISIDLLTCSYIEIASKHICIWSILHSMQHSILNTILMP